MIRRACSDLNKEWSGFYQAFIPQISHQAFSAKSDLSYSQSRLIITING